MPEALHDRRILPKVLRFVLPLSFAGTLLICGAAWFLPLEVAQSWAINSAADDDFARFEAVGAATAALTVIRWGTLFICGALVGLLTRRDRVINFVVDAAAGFCEVCSFRSTSSRQVDPGLRWQSWLLRMAVVAWITLAGYHAGKSLTRRIWEWPVYQWHSGKDVLPNISQSNRDVIRFLDQATPKNSRIFVASDQALFFLSYYLLPRRIYHKLHPDSEHVIPKENQLRRMATFRLEDIPKDEIRQLKPDYVLEYFEHPDVIDRSRLLSDANWIAFMRQRRHDPSYIPDCEVRLRRIDEWSRP